MHSLLSANDNLKSYNTAIYYYTKKNIILFKEN